MKIDVATNGSQREFYKNFLKNEELQCIAGTATNLTKNFDFIKNKRPLLGADFPRLNIKFGKKI